MKIELTSVGFGSIGQQGWSNKIKVNGESVLIGGRGLNIAIIDHRSGKVKIAQAFDTHGSDEASANAQSFILHNSHVHDLIAIVVLDEAVWRLHRSLRTLLRQLGSTEIWHIGFRKPWLFCCCVSTIKQEQGKIVDITGIKLLERHADTEIPITDACEIELLFERDARLKAEAEARAAAERLAANQAQIQAALTARQREEEARRRAEAALLTATTNNTIAQLNNTVQQRRLLLTNTRTEIANALDLLVELNGNSAELTNLRTTLNAINQRRL